jgi:hypothetical protein
MALLAIVCRSACVLVLMMLVFLKTLPPSLLTRVVSLRVDVTVLAAFFPLGAHTER